MLTFNMKLRTAALAPTTVLAGCALLGSQAERYTPPPAGSTYERDVRPHWRTSMRRLLIAFGLLMSTDALADAKAGEEKAQLCLFCHNPGITHAAPLLEAQPLKYLVQTMTEYQTGKRPNPFMQMNVAHLSARDIRDIADYFASRAPIVGAFSTDPAKVAVGEKRVTESKCASCHGPTFAGTDEVPRLAGQRPAYLRMTLRAFAEGRRAHPPIEMPFDKIGDVEAIADYFAAAR